MTEGDVTASSCTVGFVGADSSFTILSDADLEPHVTALKDAEDAPAGISCCKFLQPCHDRHGKCSQLIVSPPRLVHFLKAVRPIINGRLYFPKWHATLALLSSMSRLSFQALRMCRWRGC